ncbi:helix-turn-helix domain-containing protein [Actinomadura sp. HBU206391]|uniref:helix-turn-helix domain-containing protein n=1 Tax=Actinomadura sp. HBU206391 TaxID=2731692 RepID=UPI001650D180|nr:helix-turn-helix transcriptional regulator [Actinomadura sp. HBU206391]MBC6458441.1 helix-turn-helix domain-containing protein [Actinomadura sp. HBU206391]
MHDANTDPANPDLTVGQRVKFFRQRRGLSREALGGLVGRSGRWVKAIESGQLQQPKLPVLIRLAEVLKVRDLSHLTGDQSMPMTLLTGPGHPALPAVRNAVNSIALPTPGRPPSLEYLQARLDAAWRTRHASPDHRTVLGGLLPDMIRDGRYAVRAFDGADRRRALAILAQTYNLAQFFVAYQPAADLLWRVAERAVMAAEESEDLKTFGGAVWLLVQAHRDAGDFEAAETLNRQALDVLRPGMRDADDDLRAMWGALHFEAAYTAARAGEKGTAWRWWEQADAVASNLPSDHYDPMTSFSRVIMQAHAVTVAVELRQGAESARQARRSAGAAIPSQPRRGRHLIEVARAWQVGDDPAAMLSTLKDAYVAAPETIRYNGYARRMVLELTEGPQELRREAHELADRVGLLV